MKISRSTQYGLIALCYIAQQGGLVMSQEISKKYNIPLEYLLKILNQLARAGILRSKRGPRGGFKLGKQASEMSLLDVIEAVDGPMRSNLEIADITKNEPFAIKLEKSIKDVLGVATSSYFSISLSDILG